MVPKYKYPFDENRDHNALVDSKTLDLVEDTLINWSAQVAGVILEPVQVHNCGFTFSGVFAKQLQQILNPHNVSLIIDES
ncbi:MAG: aminotransferase class III-fold pyridoxal phosphate-dependent enzyme [Bacteroidota bacterium]